MTKSTSGNANAARLGAQGQSEWVIDVSDASMTLNHMPTGLVFWLKRNGTLESWDDEDHPEFENVFETASQIAEELANEEWGS